MSGLRAQPSQASLKSSIGSDFLKFFSGGNTPANANANAAAQHKKTRDGQPAKRRGPKPDSKPAMTRRQELNRQAQRTHRERKEQYMRALETEVSRLREAYTQEISSANLALHQHRQMVHSLNEDNDILKDMLAAHGIAYEAELVRRRSDRPATTTAAPQYPPPRNPVPPPQQHHHHSQPHRPSTSPLTGSLASTVPPAGPAYTTPPTTVSSNQSPFNGPSDISPKSDSVSYVAQESAFLDGSGPIGAMNAPVQAFHGVFETDPQLQVDFILTLESPCREHTDYLCRRSVAEADDEDMPFSGHALMATCPPPSYIDRTTNESPYPHKTYDLPLANLGTLLNLSRQLVTEGQITPIMALQCLKHHDLYRTLTRDDVKIIIETLNTKVRCYGFGAVVEDFELADCLSSVLGTKVDAGFRDDLMYS